MYLTMLVVSVVLAATVAWVLSTTFFTSLSLFSWEGSAWLTSLTFLIWLTMLWREGHIKLFQEKKQEQAKNNNHERFVLQLDPIVGWPVFSLVSSTIIAGLLVIGLWLALEVFGLVTNQFGTVSVDLPVEFWQIAWILLWLYGFFFEPKPPEKVPEARMWAVVTFRGLPLRIVRLTGDYGWQGTAIGLGRTTKAVGLKKSEDGKVIREGEFVDANGFVRAGIIQFEVWDKADSKAANTIINAPAKNRADIKTSLTLIMRVKNPLPLLAAEDPEQDIGDRARQEFRELTGWFVDTDLSALQEGAGEVLMGATLITCFLPNSLPGYKKGGMIRDTGDQVMFEIIPKGEEHRTQEIIKTFKERIEENAQPDMKVEVTKNGEIRVRQVRVKKPISDLLHELGIVLERVTIGDVIFAPDVSAAANQASAQTDQHATQLASARTNKAARQELLPTEDELKSPGWKDAMYLAAAQDPDMQKNTRLVITPGGNPYVQAAVAGASVLKGDKDDDNTGK